MEYFPYIPHANLLFSWWLSGRGLNNLQVTARGLGGELVWLSAKKKLGLR
jgi:hypothetical protein